MEIWHCYAILKCPITAILNFGNSDSFSQSFLRKTEVYLNRTIIENIIKKLSKNGVI